jgi:hypothetical protein
MRKLLTVVAAALGIAMLTAVASPAGSGLLAGIALTGLD